MNFYENNIELLNKKEPHLVEKLKTVSLDKAYSENKEYFSFEERDIKNADLLVILGFEISSHIENLLKMCPPKTFILIIEKNLSLFKNALYKKDFSYILNSDKISISVDETPFIATMLRLEKYFSILTFKEMYIIKYPPSIEKYPKYYQEVEEKLKESLSMAITNVATFMHYSPIWKKNILTNFIYMINCAGVSILSNKFKNIPTIIVCAGPSLDKNIKHLKKVNNRALIICTDTALKTMLKNNILPHMVITVDGTMKNYCKCYQNLNIPKNIYLVSDLIVYPKTFSKFTLSNIFILNDGHPLVQWLGRFLGFDSYIPRGGSVSTAAFNLALKLGSDPIIFIGQDLSFPEGKLYSKEVLSKDRNHLKNELINFSPQLIEVSDIFGRKVVTSRALYGFIKWFENRASHFKVNCINATEGGALMQGFSNLTLNETIKNYLHKPFPIQDILLNHASNFQNPNTHSFLDKTTQLLEEYQMIFNLCIQVLNIIKRFSLNELNQFYINNLFMQLGTIKKDILSLENFTFCERLQIEPLIYELSNQKPDTSLKEKLRILNKIFLKLRNMSNYTISMLSILKAKLEDKNAQS
ncbi:MAG: DUF115 domain-containing protein [bacterium]|nr:DUF115 domain-containing protein [bacterium]